MRLIFHPDAETEFDHAVAYYEHRQSGLGRELADEVLVTITNILEYPWAGSPFSKNTRRCLTNRFPYGSTYQMQVDIVRTIAVADLSCRPGYWKDKVLQSKRLHRGIALRCRSCRRRYAP